MLRSIRFIATVAALAFIATACSDNDSNDSPPSPAPASTAQVRAVHASADTGAVDILANGAPAFRGVTFGQASAAADLAPGSTRLQVNPAGTSTSAIDVTVPLAAGRTYTAIAAGNSAAGTPADRALGAVLIDDPGNTPQAGNVKLRVVHAAPGVPAVDIFVTAPDDALPATPTIAALAFKQSAPESAQRALEIAGGNYRVRATVAGARTIAYDSGAVALAAGADLLLIAVPTPGSAAPITLLTLPKGASAFNIADQRARVRVGHFSPNTPTVDVYLRTPGAPLDAGNLVVPDAVFGVASSYLPVVPGSYRASVALDNTSAEAIGADATLAARAAASVFAIGLIGGAGSQALRLQSYIDDLAPPPAGRAKLRVIHLSPDAPAVDVVVLDAGGAIAARLVTNLAFPAATAGSLDLAPATYRVAVVPTGAVAPLLPAAAGGGLPGVDLTLAAGDIATAVAIGCLGAAGPCAGAGAFQIRALKAN